MISAGLYKEIADLINSAQERGAELVSDIEQMETDLSNSEIPSDDIYRLALESSISTTKERMEDSHNSLTERAMMKFVRALQDHVNNNYTSVNDFLSDNGIKVYSTFASLSANAGYTIENEHILNVS